MTGNAVNDFEWSDEYDIGIERIDKAHREIFQIVRLLVEKNMSGNRQAIMETVNFMRDYVIWHFRDEEEYMAEISYSDIKEHIRFHRDFKNSVLPGIEKKLTENDYDAESVEEFVSILLNWIKRHIMVSDKKIGGA